MGVGAKCSDRQVKDVGWKERKTAQYDIETLRQNIIACILKAIFRLIISEKGQTKSL